MQKKIIVSIWLLFIGIMLLTVAVVTNTDNEAKKTREDIRMFQTTIDSLISKNDYLHKSLIDVWDENANKNIQIDKLTRDNKWLRRVKR